MIGVLIMLVFIAGFVAWDRRSPVSASPNVRLVGFGVVLAAIGGFLSLMMWWLVVPVLVFFAGCALIVIGRHRGATV